MRYAIMESPLLASGSNAELAVPLNAIAQPTCDAGGPDWRREWRKYCCRPYDKNRDAILAKHRDAYQKRREGQPKKPMGRPKLSRDPPGSNKRRRCGERLNTH